MILISVRHTKHEARNNINRFLYDSKIFVISQGKSNRDWVWHVEGDVKEKGVIRSYLKDHEIKGWVWVA